MRALRSGALEICIKPTDAIYMFPAVRETAAAFYHRWNGRDWEIERGIVKPCLQDVVIHPYERPDSNQWMIFPYELVPHNGGMRARLIQPDEMQRDYPGCWAYLSARRGELEARNIVGGSAAEKQFYQFGRSQSLTKIFAALDRADCRREGHGRLVISRLKLAREAWPRPDFDRNEAPDE